MRLSLAESDQLELRPEETAVLRSVILNEIRERAAALQKTLAEAGGVEVGANSKGYAAPNAARPRGGIRG